MSQCDHKTEAEYGLCTRCSSFAMIAKDARRLMKARKAYLDGLLVLSGSDLDVLQEKLSDATKRLETSVKLAEDANLWD